MIAAARRVYGLPAALAWAIACFPVVSSLILGGMMAVPATHDRGVRLLMEDRLVENLTFIFYFLAAALAALWVVRLVRARAGWGATTGAGLAAVLCFTLGMEEISWGERVLHFRVPDLFLHYNVQSEPTIHNLEPFHDLGRWVPLFFSLLALADIAFRTKPRRDEAGLPSLLLPYCWTILPLSAYDNFTDWVPINLEFDTLVGRLTEHVELLVAVGLALAIGLAMRRQRLKGMRAPNP